MMISRGIGGAQSSGLSYISGGGACMMAAAASERKRPPCALNNYTDAGRR
jgi:hypothetical protein